MPDPTTLTGIAELLTGAGALCGGIAQLVRALKRRRDKGAIFPALTE